MIRTLTLAFGVASYAVAMAALLYAVGFIGNFAVPTSLDGAPTVPIWTAIPINLALLTVFAVQHSTMARPAVKTWLAQYMPRTIERSLFVMLSGVLMLAMFALWQPMGGTVWTVTSLPAQAAIYTLYGLGWAIVVYSTFLINHFDLFGLRQVWLRYKNEAYTPVAFKNPWLYRIVRHPLYFGMIIAFWAAPTMTIAHLLFAVATTAYILIGIQLEERDLIAEHGETYAAYRKQVPMLVPRLLANSSREQPEQIQPASTEPVARG